MGLVKAAVKIVLFVMMKIHAQFARMDIGLNKTVASRNAWLAKKPTVLAVAKKMVTVQPVKQAFMLTIRKNVVLAQMVVKFVTTAKCASDVKLARSEM